MISYSDSSSEPPPVSTPSEFPCCVSFFFCGVNYDASAESREVCLLKQRVVSLSVLQNLRQNQSSQRKRRPISDGSWIHQEPCNETYESWSKFRRLPCKTALQEQMFVPFAEAAKSAFSVASEHVRKKDCGNTDGQTVLRKQDEWLISSVIHKHSGECPKHRTC